MPKDTKQEKKGLRLRVVLDTNVYASAFNFPHGKVVPIWVFLPKPPFGYIPEVTQLSPVGLGLGPIRE
jgi:hypothetical protein